MHNTFPVVPVQLLEEAGVVARGGHIHLFLPLKHDWTAPCAQTNYDMYIHLRTNLSLLVSLLCVLWIYVQYLDICSVRKEVCYNAHDPTHLWVSTRGMVLAHCLKQKLRFDLMVYVLACLKGQKRFNMATQCRKIS